jgi:hypothetical protein
MLLEWSQNPHINRKNVGLQASGRKKTSPLKTLLDNRGAGPGGRVVYRSTTACLLGLRIQIPPGAWMSVSCVCWVLAGKGHCDEPIPLLEVSYLMRACDQGLK